MIDINPQPWPDAPWIPYALAELGQREIPGAADNPRVVLYHSYAGGRSPDSVPWCSGLVCFCVEMAGIASTKRKNARSWLKWGYPLTEPRKGCIVVFSRPPNPASGHVGFYVGETADSILVLGGNQGNAVSIKPYPKRRVLGYRWPNA